MEMIQVQYYQSPYGELIFGSFEGKLCMCDWVNEKRREVNDCKRHCMPITARKVLK